MKGDDQRRLAGNEAAKSSPKSEKAGRNQEGRR